MRHDLPLLEAGQAQKEITHNQAVERIGYLLHIAVEGPSSAAPPASPTVGQSYLVAASATDAWTGYDHHVARMGEGGWVFLAPTPGMIVWNMAADSFGYFDGASWKPGVWAATQFAVNGVKVVGAQLPAIGNPSGGATIDAQARTSIAQILDALRTHGLIAV